MIFQSFQKKRFIEEFKLSPYEANILVSDIDTSKYFEEVVAKMGKNKDIKLEQSIGLQENYLLF